MSLISRATGVYERADTALRGQGDTLLTALLVLAGIGLIWAAFALPPGWKPVALAYVILP